jgi:hypothetical protein
MAQPTLDQRVSALELEVARLSKLLPGERESPEMDRSVESDFATTAISLEEQMRGWLAAINRARNFHNQLLFYQR